MLAISNCVAIQNRVHCFFSEQPICYILWEPKDWLHVHTHTHAHTQVCKCIFELVSFKAKHYNTQPYTIYICIWLDGGDGCSVLLPVNLQVPKLAVDHTCCQLQKYCTWAGYNNPYWGFWNIERVKFHQHWRVLGWTGRFKTTVWISPF